MPQQPCMAGQLQISIAVVLCLQKSCSPLQITIMRILPLIIIINIIMSLLFECVLVLQSDSDAILSQLGLAVMGALQDKLLEMDDFEALITYLKVCHVPNSVATLMCLLTHNVGLTDQWNSPTHHNNVA